MRKNRWMDLVIAGIMIVLITACGQAAQDTPPTEATQTQVPITSTTLPSTSTPAPTNTSIPPTRTPFPASCTPADSTILEVIRAFEVLANEKNLEGTMELLAENAIIEESFRGVFKEGTAEIEAFWRVYYWGSPPAEFRDIMICGNMATFVWVELHALRALFWPVVIEIHNGKITYLDFYEDSTIGSLGDE